MAHFLGRECASFSWSELILFIVSVLPVFDAPGECERPDALGVHVEETIRTKDIFGGV